MNAGSYGELFWAPEISVLGDECLKVSFLIPQSSTIYRKNMWVVKNNYDTELNFYVILTIHLYSES